MATVPIQQTPSVELETGQAPLFSATNIQPVQDTGVAQDITRLSNAQKQFAEIALKLQDEQNDIKSNEAYRGNMMTSPDSILQGVPEAALMAKDGGSIVKGEKVAKLKKKKPIQIRGFGKARRG